ncbi:MAG: LacI family DNA-binding transcriptional regulator [Janthinobacterium lividum]
MPSVVKITDVAREARVSVATVSRALNNSAPVDPALATRVHDAVRKLGYRPNGLARNLRKQGSQVWALVITDINNPFYTAVARGLEDVASDAGFSLLLCNSDEDRGKEARYLQIAERERVAGLVLAARNPDCDVSRLLASGIPVIAVDRTIDAAVDYVLARSREGARAATEHLLAGGWSRPACVTGPHDAQTAEQRRIGYADAVGAHGLPELVAHVGFHDDAGLHAVVEDLLDSERPDSLFVANSVLALGVLDVLKRRKIRVGRDLGLITFDDAPWCALLEPAVSVVAQPAYRIGTEAGRLLLRRIAGQVPPEPAHVVLDTELVVRRSSLRPRSGVRTGRPG